MSVVRRAGWSGVTGASWAHPKTAMPAARTAAHNDSDELFGHDNPPFDRFMVKDRASRREDCQEVVNNPQRKGGTAGPAADQPGMMCVPAAMATTWMLGTLPVAVS